MKKIFLILSLLLLMIQLDSKSTWDDRAGNIYSRKVFFNDGDSIQIVITENSAIAYKSSGKSLKNFKFNITGNEMSGMFSFLPAGSVEDSKNSQETDNLKINTTISARVIRNAGNYVTVRGIKQISVNNKTSSIEITGDASIADISGNSILSTKLTNQTLRITTLLDNQNNVILPKDLETTVKNPDSTTDKKTEVKLSDAKKQELMLRYFNKLLNLIF